MRDDVDTDNLFLLKFRRNTGRYVSPNNRV